MQRVWFSSLLDAPKGLPIFPLHLADPMVGAQIDWAGLRHCAVARQPQRHCPQSRSPFSRLSLFSFDSESDEPPDCWVNTS